MADLQAPLDRPLVGYRVWLSGRWPEPPGLVSMSWPVAWGPDGRPVGRFLAVFWAAIGLLLIDAVAGVLLVTR